MLHYISYCTLLGFCDIFIVNVDVKSMCSHFALCYGTFIYHVASPISLMVVMLLNISN